MTVVVVLLAVVLGLVVVLLAGLLRSHADILRALHSLGITEDELRAGSGASTTFRTSAGVSSPRAEADRTGDEQATDLTGVTPSGGAVRVAVGGTDHLTLLAFLSSGCLTCREFWDAFGRGVDLPGADTRLVAVTQGPEAESPARVADLAGRDLDIVMSSQAWTDYAVPVAPYFILVDGVSSTVIGEGAAATWDKVAELLQKALADTGRVPGRTQATGRRRAGREADTDEALARAGIVPDDPRLHHEPTADAEADRP